MIGLLFSASINAMRRTPWQSMIVVLLIALGIGVCVPMMTVYYHLNKSPLPDKGVHVYRVLLDSWTQDSPFSREQPNEPARILTHIDAQNLMKSAIPKYQAPMFDSEAIIAPESRVVKPFKVAVRMTGADFFPMFDVPVAQGTAWTREMDDVREPVVVLSHSLAQNLFDEQSAVGQKIRVNNNVFKVIGVLGPWQVAPKFYDMKDPFAPMDDLYMPYNLMFGLQMLPNYSQATGRRITSTAFNFEEVHKSTNVSYVSYWVELNSASDESRYIDYLNQYVEEQKALGRFPRPLNNRVYNVETWLDKSMEQSRAAKVTVTLVFVGVLFFTVCLLNSIGLLLAKLFSSQKYVAILRALGAAKHHVFALHLAEVTILSLIGGMLGVFFAKFGLSGVAFLFGGMQQSVGLGAGSYFEEFTTLDGAMILISLSIAVLGGVLAGLLPAWRSCNVSPSSLFSS